MFHRNLVSPSEGGECVTAERSLNLNQVPFLHDVESKKPLISWTACVAFNVYSEDVLHICRLYSASFVACRK